MDETLSKLADRVAECRDGRTVACAESFTAGLVAQALATSEGASEWFCGGVVAYQVAVKQSVLGVQRHQVVSDPAAREMAEGVARLLGADAGISTTGVAGPDDQDGIPAGTVVVGWFVGGRTGSETMQFSGDPEDVVHQGARAALEHLCRQLGG